MIRRILIAALALSMTGLGPAPQSLCSILGAKVGECATPGSQQQCDHMDMGQGENQAAPSPDRSCCSLSGVPVTGTRPATFDVSVTAATAVLGRTVQALSTGVEQQLGNPETNLSPPPRQSVLCTFLI